MFLWPTQKRKVNTFVHVHISGILIFHVGHFRAVRINVVKTGEEVLFLDWCDHRGFWNLEKSGNIPNRSVRLTWGPSKFLFMSVDDTVLRLCWAQDRLVELKSFFYSASRDIIFVLTEGWMTSLRAGYRLLNALLIVNESGSFRILLLDIYFITLQLFGW